MYFYVFEEVPSKYFYNMKYTLTGDHVGSVTESKREVGRGMERNI